MINRTLWVSDTSAGKIYFISTCGATECEKYGIVLLLIDMYPFLLNIVHINELCIYLFDYNGYTFTVYVGEKCTACTIKYVQSTKKLLTHGIII